MARNYRLIAVRVKRHLNQRPRTLLRDLARKLKADRHTISKVLIASYGLSFRALQRDLIKRKAIRFLHKKDLLGKEIAAKIGYVAPESLTRFVKKATGKTPTQLRRGD